MGTALSRRALLQGIAASAGLVAARPFLAATRPAGAVPSGVALPGGPGSLPFPNLPEGTDTLPQISSS